MQSQFPKFDGLDCKFFSCDALCTWYSFIVAALAHHYMYTKSVAKIVIKFVCDPSEAMITG